MEQTCAGLANEIMEKYDSNRYSQEDLAKEYEIPLETIRRLTQQNGYIHGKRELINPITIENEVQYLIPYLKY